MTPVFQTIISGTEGNCMQAAIASLIDLPLEEVPNFKESGVHWHRDMCKFLWDAGYEYQGSIRNPKDFGSWGKDDLDKVAERSPGLDGHYFAVVYSPAFADFRLFNTNECVTTHAVIVDADCNIVHDPNPANAGRVVYPGHLKLGHNGVLEVFMIEKRKDNEQDNSI
jgi:hypothetical protein